MTGRTTPADGLGTRRPGRMADPAYRAEQEAGVYAPHVRPINELVDQLRDQDGRGWVPYVAPMHGGTRARVLSILRDPGPATQADSGSGFLCIENDDETALRQRNAFSANGIQARDITPWNAYPWYINRKPLAGERDAGAHVLAQLVPLMPDLRVVLLQGNEAHDCWDRLARRTPRLKPPGAVEIVRTYHPGKQALFHRDPIERARRSAHRDAAIRRVAELLR